MPQTPDSFDKWGDLHKAAEGYSCHPQKLRVYFPIVEPNAEQWFEAIRALLNTEFRGSTVYDGEGSWMDDDTGELVIEPVKVIEVAHNCHTPDQINKVARIVRSAAKATNQTSISIEANQFHIIPSNAMQANE